MMNDCQGSGINDAAVDAINVLMNTQYVPAYWCQVYMLAPQFHHQYSLSVNPIDRGYKLVQVDNDVEWSFDPAEGIEIQESRRVERSRSRDAFESGPNALMLAFPSLLPIWGRSNQYRVIGADRDGQRVILLLRHHDPRLVATLTVDCELGLAVSFDSSTQTCRYENIRLS